MATGAPGTGDAGQGIADLSTEDDGRDPTLGRFCQLSGIIQRDVVVIHITQERPGFLRRKAEGITTQAEDFPPCRQAGDQLGTQIGNGSGSKYQMAVVRQVEDEGFQKLLDRLRIIDEVEVVDEKPEGKLQRMDFVDQGRHQHVVVAGLPINELQ